MYISFSRNGIWITPKLLFEGPRCPSTSFVTRDGKYVFLSHDWASSEIIEGLSSGIAYNTPPLDIHKIYPNPAQNSVTLSLVNESPKDVDLTISNLSGQILYAKNIESVLSYSERIDISGFDAGLYLVKACKSVFKLIVVSGF